MVPARGEVPLGEVLGDGCSGGLGAATGALVVVVVVSPPVSLVSISRDERCLRKGRDVAAVGAGKRWQGGVGGTHFGERARTAKGAMRGGVEGG